MSWRRRTAELHAELAAIAEVDPTWWLLAGAAAAAEPLPARARYVISDAEPDGDTFIGHRSPSPDDPIRDAIARAHAARASLRDLDGQLPEQPLAVTVRRGELGARVVPSALDVAAFAIGETVVLARLAERIEDEARLAASLLAIARAATVRDRPRWDTSLLAAPANATPFVCVSIGEDRITVARHGHRRAWSDDAGPWLGLGRVGELATVSTCHMVVDGYGHAWLAGKIAEHHARLVARLWSAAARDGRIEAARDEVSARAIAAHDVDVAPPAPRALGGPAPMLVDLPHLSLVAGAIPLGVAWREVPSPAPRALELAYALGRVLHRVAGAPAARFSPTFQIPIAPGRPDDPERAKRRVVPSTLSVRFERGEPEPLDAFAARARAILAREAEGRGLCARLLTAARAAPVPLAYKRRSFTAARSGWFDRIAEVVGGRACLSKLRLATPVPLSCAVSSPARLATKADPVGGCVLTIIDDGQRAAITACGSGLAGTGDDAADLIDAVLALL